MLQGGHPPHKDADPAAPTEIDRVLRHVSILVVDDEPGMRNFLVRIFEPRCKRIEAAASAEEASQLLDSAHFDLVLLDNVMPGQSGLDWLTEQRRVGLFAEAILMTAYADLDTAIQALRVGAADFVLKPFRSNQILNAVNRCMDQRYLRRENYLLKYELKADALAARGRLIGKSPRIEAVRKTLEQVAPPADAGAVHRRERHRQGDCRAHPPRAFRPGRQTLRADQLRRDLSRPARGRAVWRGRRRRARRAA